MSGNKGFFGGLFCDDCTVLFFIILFLLLFWGRGKFGAFRDGVDPVDTGLSID